MLFEFFGLHRLSVRVITRVYLEPSRTSVMELPCEVNGGYSR